ncbi:MAG TPA: hypothetical protein VEF53_06810 [Patescibacteria group bacterium]|nr:hypothetical protein [Patescibacteria group bacterium]
MRKNIIFGILILIIATSIVGCSSKVAMDTNDNAGKAFASWVNHYDNASDMIHKADLIVKGKLVDEMTEKRVDLIFTKAVIEVSKVYKGDIKENDTVTILQTGGEMNGEKTEPFDDAPLLKNDGEYILFLTHTSEGHYLIAGGYQGAGKIKNSKVVFNVPDDEATKEFKNKSIVEVENLIKENNK